METHGGKILAEAIKTAYAQGFDDYHMKPIRIEGSEEGVICDGDSVIFCCRRGEREIELTDFFVDRDFDKVERRFLPDLHFVLLTQYHEKYRGLPIAFPPVKVDRPLSQVLSEAGKTQFHCAESEKFAHVTFFFNGGNNQGFAQETDVCVPSPKVDSFAQVPELSLDGVVQKTLDALGRYDFLVVNFANGDVIGHTSSKDAKLEACRLVSIHLQSVVRKALSEDYVVAITADHGNIEKLYASDGRPDVAHTTNLVSFVLIDPRNPCEPISLASGGALKDVAPTVLAVMGLKKALQMTGESLVREKDWGEGRRMLLLILDGWGLGSGDDNDAIHLADTPYWDMLLKTQSWTKLEASGAFVGLGEGKPGNSEAGHMNLGAGRCVVQDDIRIDTAIEDGSFASNAVILKALREAKVKNRALHLLAYLTYKSSHGSLSYSLAVCEMAKKEGVANVYLHVILDGRSSEPGSAPVMLEYLEKELEKIGIGKIVDVVGRGIALDRDQNYAKVKLAYDLMVEGEVGDSPDCNSSHTQK